MYDLDPEMQFSKLRATRDNPLPVLLGLRRGVAVISEDTISSLSK
ncbi:unnamed protein product, partial [Choristocarpus tenellus]